MNVTNTYRRGAARTSPRERVARVLGVEESDKRVAQAINDARWAGVAGGRDRDDAICCYVENMARLNRLVSSQELKSFRAKFIKTRLHSTYKVAALRLVRFKVEQKYTKKRNHKVPKQLLKLPESPGKLAPACRRVIEKRCERPPPTWFEGLEIPSYTGELKNFEIVSYIPSGSNDLFACKIDTSTFRRWVCEAALHHGVPHELAAVILQQENGPNASTLQKVLQAGERVVTTLAALVDSWLWDLVPDKLSGGSSGIANLQRRTLQGAAEYIEKSYPGHPVLPDEIRYRLWGWVDSDTRLQGADVLADLYYMTAHLRQLINQKKGRCYSGPLTVPEMGEVAAAYNGTGREAKKYGEDAVERLNRASRWYPSPYVVRRAKDSEPLYFYECNINHKR